MRHTDIDMRNTGFFISRLFSDDFVFINNTGKIAPARLTRIFLLAIHIKQPILHFILCLFRNF